MLVCRVRVSECYPKSSHISTCTHTQLHIYSYNRWILYTYKHMARYSYVCRNNRLIWRNLNMLTASIIPVICDCSIRVYLLQDCGSPWPNNIILVIGWSLLCIIMSIIGGKSIEHNFSIIDSQLQIASVTDKHMLCTGL